MVPWLELRFAGHLLNMLVCYIVEPVQSQVQSR